ncbi:MAG TPA: LuxR C-terminal-related transcriptional regulator [Fimbriimonadaceae bacterium]|nr:LuxR C-terminal-related transcriptional regulator [Fimbriimonadaceae bacterium]
MRGTRAGQILELASQGLTDKEIAKNLGIAVGTVGSHWKKIRQEYGMTSRTGIIARWLSDRSPQTAELHAASEELLRTHRTLAEVESLARLNELLHHTLFWSTTCLYSMDLHGAFKCLYISKSVEKLGWTREEWTNGSIKIAEIIHPDDVLAPFAARAEWAKKGGRCAAYLYRLMTPARGDVWFYDRQGISANTIYEPGYSLGLATDMTPLIDKGLLTPKATYWLFDDELPDSW